MNRTFNLTVRTIWIVALFASLPLEGALYDEIQVYADELNAPGKFGLDIHLNTTLKGRTQPEYRGEETPDHGYRINPEFSYGLARTLELGAYLPMSLAADGNFRVAGGKLRLKWLPIREPEDGSGWFAGANLELSLLQRRFEQGRWSTELRLIAGYRDPNWLVAVNVIPSWVLGKPTRNAAPDLNIDLKVSRTVAKGIALGAEYYGGFGSVRAPLSLRAQSDVLYAVLDFDRKPFVFNFGVGRGLTAGSDAWTLKAIVSIPF